MSLTTRIVQMHLVSPAMPPSEIAQALGCTDAYVRAVAQRKDLRLPRSPYGAVPTYGATYARRRRQAPE